VPRHFSARPTQQWKDEFIFPGVRIQFRRETDGKVDGLITPSPLSMGRWHSSTVLALRRQSHNPALHQIRHHQTGFLKTARILADCQNQVSQSQLLFPPAHASPLFFYPPRYCSTHCNPVSFNAGTA
jgi:hypothetical protein